MSPAVADLSPVEIEDRQALLPNLDVSDAVLRYPVHPAAGHAIPKREGTAATRHDVARATCEIPASDVPPGNSSRYQRLQPARCHYETRLLGLADEQLGHEVAGLVMGRGLSARATGHGARPATRGAQPGGRRE